MTFYNLWTDYLELGTILGLHQINDSSIPCTNHRECPAGWFNNELVSEPSLSWSTPDDSSDDSNLKKHLSCPTAGGDITMPLDLPWLRMGSSQNEPDLQGNFSFASHEVDDRALSDGAVFRYAEPHGTPSDREYNIAHKDQTGGHPVPTPPENNSTMNIFTSGVKHRNIWEFTSPEVEQRNHTASYRRPHEFRLPPMDKPHKPTSHQYCAFCRTNGEINTVYMSHVLKDSYGRTTCPFLRKYTCPFCGSSGDDAHTMKYCPLNVTGISTAPLKTGRKASGRRREY